MFDLISKELDFSQESNLKERLWEQIQQKMNEHSPLREEVEFDQLGPKVKLNHAADAVNDILPQHQKDHGRQK